MQTNVWTIFFSEHFLDSCLKICAAKLKYLFHFSLKNSFVVLEKALSSLSDQVLVPFFSNILPDRLVQWKLQLGFIYTFFTDTADCQNKH